ncbi:lipoyl(octanoyl) transferase LipB [Corynebacterium durum]|uniref:lipoyl(octanoyl) transferase LipB n=1 Tax=Corynebacterium durum TaxID=61592 RepID=UPI0028EDB635|nr:lipoyl(octanoyl) transferase LipB [Corynebacterium durum]
MTAPRAPFTAPDQPIRDISTPLEVYNLGTVDYVEMWDRQAELAAQRADGLINDQLLFLEHPNTYTAGKRTQPEDRPTNGLPVVDVDRGGRITWHGPGQLVCYPIIKLAEPVDVVDYVRRVEEAIIQVVRDLGLPDAGRVDGRSGVWIPGNDTRPERKVGALGIRVTRGVTMHGLALNCNNTLEFYQHIVPCGIADAGVTTLSAELGRDVDTHDIIAPLAAALGAAFSGELTVADHSFTRREQP